MDAMSEPTPHRGARYPGGGVPVASGVPMGSSYPGAASGVPVATGVPVTGVPVGAASGVPVGAAGVPVAQAMPSHQAQHGAPVASAVFIIPVGTRIVVRGLQSAAQHNGAEG